MPAFILKPLDADRNGANIAAKTDTAGTNFDYATLDFDATTQEHADWVLWSDTFYDSGTIYIDIVWKAAATTNNVIWQANLRGIADGGQFDGALGSDNYVSDSPAGTTEYMNKCTITIDTTGLSPSDTTIIRISRDADSTNGTDNMTGDAKFIKAIVRFNVAG